MGSPEVKYRKYKPCGETFGTKTKDKNKIAGVCEKTILTIKDNSGKE